VGQIAAHQRRLGRDDACGRRGAGAPARRQQHAQARTALQQTVPRNGRAWVESVDAHSLPLVMTWRCASAGARAGRAARPGKAGLNWLSPRMPPAPLTIVGAAVQRTLETRSA
jgi:hypothetical protein